MTVAPAERWSIDRLAAVSGVSGAHFARSFKLAFGVPPHRYLLTLRLERAMAFLRDTDLPITDIALSSGWRSLGTFGRTFRDVVGVSPSAFRTRSRLSADQPGAVPVCFVRAATRPCLEMPVLEKRRRDRSDY